MITKKDMIKIARTVEEYSEMLAHLHDNSARMADMQARLKDIMGQRTEVLVSLEKTHELLSKIKTEQQALVGREREIAALEQATIDHIKQISDDTEAILKKLEESNSEE